MHFCCNEMKHHVESNELHIGYIAYTREYYIDYKSIGSVQVIKFCPWCGKKLQSSLRDKWADELEKFEIFDPFGDDRSEVPAEFWTGEWWESRRL